MLNVVAAVIHNAQGQLLIAQRPLHKHHGGLWEFAGGKVDANETPAQSLVSKLQEELGITANQYDLQGPNRIADEQLEELGDHSCVIISVQFGRGAAG